MIEKKTVFVLGAGAQCSYKFPAGDKLKELVAENLISQKTRTDVLSMTRLVNLGLTNGKHFDMQALHALGTSIRKAGQLSIDAYLNNNRHIEFVEVFGKAAIAQVLLGFEERIGDGGATDDDWLSYLFAIMVRGTKGAGIDAAHDFAHRNRVSFVTFNYDRFLERWLHRRIQSSFGISDTDALAVLRKIEICHVFGSLGPYPQESTHLPWVDATKRIRLIHDAERDDTEGARARFLVQDAEAMCILGFAFHPENVSVLGLDDAVHRCTGGIMASAYELTDVEWSRLMTGMNASKISRGKMDWQCLRTLRNAHVL